MGMSIFLFLYFIIGTHIYYYIYTHVHIRLVPQTAAANSAPPRRILYPNDTPADFRPSNLQEKQFRFLMTMKCIQSKIEITGFVEDRMRSLRTYMRRSMKRFLRESFPPAGDASKCSAARTLAATPVRLAQL